MKDTLDNEQIQIAIIDDHRLLRDSLEVLFHNQQDLQVVFNSGSGSKFLNYLKNQKRPDILILDLEMKDLRGFEVLEKIQNHLGEGLKVIILSMHFGLHPILESFKKGCMAYLSKDIEANELIYAIRHVHSKGYYIDEQIGKILTKQKLVKGAEEKLPLLSDKEVKILKLICTQKSNIEIALITKHSLHTINSYRKDLLAKTGSKNALGLLLFAMENGYLIE